MGVGMPPSPNPYAPVMPVEPVQPYQPVISPPLYQPFNSGIKPGYDTRNYNAPGYQPTSGIQPNYQSRPYNQPTRFSSQSPTAAQYRTNPGYPQL